MCSYMRMFENFHIVQCFSEDFFFFSPAGKFKITCSCFSKRQSSEVRSQNCCLSNCVPQMTSLDD